MPKAVTQGPNRPLPPFRQFTVDKPIIALPPIPPRKPLKRLAPPMANTVRSPLPGSWNLGQKRRQTRSRGLKRQRCWFLHLVSPFPQRNWGRKKQKKTGHNQSHTKKSLPLEKPIAPWWRIPPPLQSSRIRWIRPGTRKCPGWRSSKCHPYRSPQKSSGTKQRHNRFFLSWENEIEFITKKTMPTKKSPTKNQQPSTLSFF